MIGQPSPIAAGERIEQLDVLRGLAVLGILLVNAPAFAMPYAVSENPPLSPLGFGPDAQAAWWVMQTFFHQKFVTLFSILFGVSVFLVGGERRVDRDRSRVLKRRLLWLMLFGVVHGALIWFGDILLLYGVIGLLMMLCRGWDVRKLMTVGTALALISTALLIGSQVALQFAPAEVQAWVAEAAGSASSVQTMIAEYRSGLAGSQAANFQAWIRLAVGSVIAFGPMTLGLMMWGLALFKAGVLQGRASLRTYTVLALCGGSALAVIGWNAQDQIRDGFPAATRGTDALPNFVLAPIATLGYIALLNLALKGGLARRAALALAPVGRMAFTNYIAQSLIMTSIFYGGRGLGLYGRLDWPEWSLVVLAVWALQLLWSPLWLSRFSMGPLEWLWRRLSYGRPVRLRRLPAAPVAA